jgi:hypothetical protein
MFGKPIMCKPSAHLVEYLENQNIQVQDIIKDLPDELPIHDSDDVDNEIDNTQVENNENNSQETVDKNIETTEVVDNPTSEVPAPTAVEQPSVVNTTPVQPSAEPAPTLAPLEPTVQPVSQVSQNPNIAGLTKLEG